MMKERPAQALLRGSHKNKGSEIRRRLRLLGAKEDEGLVTAALVRRRGEVKIALVEEYRLELSFMALEADGEVYPWLAIIDMIEKPAGIRREALFKALRKWLREFRKDREVKLTVQGEVIRLGAVTAYPDGR